MWSKHCVASHPGSVFIDSEFLETGRINNPSESIWFGYAGFLGMISRFGAAISAPPLSLI
jgi:hypothetical protein